MGERPPKKEGGEKREKSMARPQNKACMGVIYNEKKQKSILSDWRGACLQPGPGVLLEESAEYTSGVV